MDELENLFTLITAGRPTKKQIGEQLDKFISELILQFKNRSSGDLARHIFNPKGYFYEKKTFFVVANYKYHVEVFEDIKDLLLKYSPFIKIDPLHTYDYSSKPNQYTEPVNVHVPIIIDITPEIKEKMILANNLQDCLTYNSNNQI